MPYSLQAKETENSSPQPQPLVSGGALTPPTVRVTRPALPSEAESLSAAVDEDFSRLAKARSNPDILRSTLDHRDVRGEHVMFTSVLCVCIIESVESRDERGFPLMQYITNGGISRARYTITHFKHNHRVLRLISNRMSV